MRKPENPLKTTMWNVEARYRGRKNFHKRSLPEFRKIGNSAREARFNPIDGPFLSPAAIRGEFHLKNGSHRIRRNYVPKSLPHQRYPALDHASAPRLRQKRHPDVAGGSRRPAHTGLPDRRGPRARDGWGVGSGARGEEDRFHDESADRSSKHRLATAV